MFERKKSRKPVRVSGGVKMDLGLLPTCYFDFGDVDCIDPRRNNYNAVSFHFIEHIPKPEHDDVITALEFAGGYFLENLSDCWLKQWRHDFRK